MKMKSISIHTQTDRNISFRKGVFSIFTGVLLIGLLNSCGKEEDLRPSLEDGKSVVIEDLEGDIEAAMGDSAEDEGKTKRSFQTFLFRFKDKKQIWIKNENDSAQWLQTKDWDLAFTGPYNSELYVNNANEESNPGFEGDATNTAVIKIDQPYSTITEAPSDEEFDNSTVQKIGWNATENGHGWFEYDMSGHIMQAIPNRTYVIRLPEGNYAKLELFSAYLGNPPAITDLFWPAPYYTFRYFVQKDGSKNLKTN